MRSAEDQTLSGMKARHGTAWHGMARHCQMVLSTACGAFSHWPNKYAKLEARAARVIVWQSRTFGSEEFRYNSVISTRFNSKFSCDSVAAF